MLRPLLLVLTLTACTLSVLRLVSIQQFAALGLANATDSAKVARGKSEAPARSASAKTSESEAGLAGLIENPFSSFDERSKAAIGFARFAEDSSDADQKLSYLCTTLSALTASLEKEPLRARTLVTWASIKQLLGSYPCTNDNSAGFEKALEAAVAADPLDQQALFNAALIYLWAGQREKAYPIFKRVLELGTDSSSLQREFIYSLADNSDSLPALIPARLPQATDFLRYALSMGLGNTVSSLPKKAVSELQIAALRDFANRFEQGFLEGQGRLGSELYAGKLLDLWKLSRESAVTPQIDKLLASFYSEHGAEELAAYFGSRSRFTELPIEAAFRVADSRPEKSSLSNWGYVKEVTFDEFFSSVGFYLSRNTTLRRIELHSTGRTDQQLSGLIRVMQSDDNSVWEDVTGLCTTSQVALPGRTVVYVDIPGATKRFWKIHYASSLRSNTFKAALSDMVRAFGIGGFDE